MTAVVSAPGDRDDELIVECGRTAGRGFDRLIIKEDGDRRGRAPGETARLLCRGAHEAGRTVDCRTVLDEEQAIREAVRSMVEDELVVVFYEDHAAARRLLAEFGAVPAHGLPAPALAAV